MSKIDVSMIRNFFFAPQRPFQGVNGFKDGKFYLIFAAYAAAMILFASDPFFQKDGVFVYQQGIVTIFLAFVLTAAWNWELHLFGRSAGANLLLQLFQIFPVALFLARSAASPSVPKPPESFLGKTLAGFWKTFHAIFGDLLNLIPQWICDMFANFQVTILLFCVLGVLCCKSLRIKAGAFLCLGAMLIGTAISHGAGIWFWGGFLLLAAGMALQFCRYDRIVYYENIVQKIRGEKGVEPLSGAVILRAMREVAEDGKITEPQLLTLVKSEYSKLQNLSDADLRIAATEITRKMLYEYHLTEMRQNTSGAYLIARNTLFRQDNLLAAAAIVPRAVFAVALAIIWALIPVDLIPDVIPFLGTLDDVTIALFAAGIVKDIMQK